MENNSEKSSNTREYQSIRFCKFVKFNNSPNKRIASGKKKDQLLVNYVVPIIPLYTKNDKVDRRMRYISGIGDNSRIRQQRNRQRQGHNQKFSICFKRLVFTNEMDN